MALYRRDPILPEWEPVPFTLCGKAADRQEAGFHRFAQMAIHWSRIDYADFPETGLFGHDRAWFADRDVSHVATLGDEALLLIDNVWFGWPDPPRWGLVSRDRDGTKWQHWGHFPDLPASWQVPEVREWASGG